MAAYVIFCMAEVSDMAALTAYRAAARPTLAAHGPRVLCGPNIAELLEGDAMAGALVLEFEDRAAAEAWYHSPEYQAAKQLRQGATRMHAMIVDGR